LLLVLPSHTSPLLCLNAPAPPQLSTLSLHDALPISTCACICRHRFILPDERPSQLYRVLSAKRLFQFCRNNEILRFGIIRDLQRSEEHTSELQSPYDLVCRLLLEKKKKITKHMIMNT